MIKMATINPLNLWDFFINKFAGDNVIFLACLFIFVTIMCAKYRAPNRVTLILLLCTGLFMGPFFDAVLIVTLVFVGFFFAAALGVFTNK